jgi:hypothetical protein
LIQAFVSVKDVNNNTVSFVVSPSTVTAHIAPAAS